MYPSVSGGTASIAELEEYMMVDFYQDALELVSVSRELCRRLTCIYAARQKIKQKSKEKIAVVLVLYIIWVTFMTMVIKCRAMKIISSDLLQCTSLFWSSTCGDIDRPGGFDIKLVSTPNRNPIHHPADLRLV